MKLANEIIDALNARDDFRVTATGVDGGMDGFAGGISGMSAKEYLSQIRTLDVLIRQKCQELDNLHDIATSIGSFDYSRDRVQTSPDGEAPYAREAEKAAELSADIRRLEDERLEIIASIHALDDWRQVEVLYHRYVEGKRFEGIAADMGYSVQRIFQLHADGLENLEF